MSKQRAQPVLVNDIINEAFERTRKTGISERVVIKRKDFLEQNPDIGDPRLAFGGDLMIIDFDVNEEITVGELKKICNDNKDHPLSWQKKLSVMGFPDDMTVVCRKEDIRSLREDHAGVMESGVTIPRRGEAGEPKEGQLPDTDPVDMTRIPLTGDSAFDRVDKGPREAVGTDESGLTAVKPKKK